MILSRGREVSRRDFLKVTVTASGALLIASFAEACESPAPTATPLITPGPSPSDAPPPIADEPFEPNLFVRIDPDGTVTLRIHRSEMGQGVRTALAMILAEELDVDMAAVHIEQMDVESSLDQVTDGSFSVTRSFEPLRQAGAAARQLLVTAAARYWGAPAEVCRTEAGEVIHPPTDRRLGYGDLVALASDLPAPTSVAPKAPADYRLLGTSVPRVDDPAIVAGSALYGADVRVPGMLYAAVARPPVPGGRLVGHDASAAEAIPGVRAVVPVGTGIAVVADDTRAATRGRAALELAWDDGVNAGLTTESIEQRLAEVLDRARSAEPDLSSDGLEATYRTPYLAHAPMEPPSCVADARSDVCEVWAPTQNPLAVQDFVRRATRLPTTVHVTLLGGGFGRKLEVDYPVEAARISLAVGAPIQLFWTREDDIRHDFYRQVTRHWLRAGWDPDGTPRIWRHFVAAPGINGQAIRDGIGVLREGLGVDYEIPDRVWTPYLVDIPVATGPWRAVMSAPNAFANECFLDEVAGALGRDPLELRLDLLPDGGATRRVLELAADEAGWGSDLPPGRGRGVAVQTYHGTAVAMIAEASVEAGRARVHRVDAAIDCGRVIHPDMLAQQIEGAVAYGLSSLLDGRISHASGRVEQGNFHDYPILGLAEMPDVQVHVVPSDDPPRGIGEVGVPPVVPAVANAIFDAVGVRVRQTPIEAGELVS